MSERPNYYGILPANVRYCPDLKPNAKIFFTEITALADHSGYCFASNGYFADLYDVDPLTVSRWVSQLQSLGFIRVRHVDGQRQISVDGLTKRSRGVDKKIKGPLTKKSTPPLTKKSTIVQQEISTTRLINDDGAKKKAAFEETEIVFSPGPRERQPFRETEWASDSVRWHSDMAARYPELDLVNLEYYRGRAAKWSGNTGTGSADWLGMVADWIADDHKKGKLKLKSSNSTQQHETNRPNPSSNAATNGGDDLARHIERAERLAHKFGGGGGKQ